VIQHADSTFSTIPFCEETSWPGCQQVRHRDSHDVNADGVGDLKQPEAYGSLNDLDLTTRLSIL